MPRVGTGISTEEVRDASILIECFLIHTRVLRYFFANERLRKDDIIASDFVSGWSPPSETEVAYISAENDRLDKALAHLTTRRIAYDTKGKYWDVTRIMKEIQPLIERFLAELPDDRRGWFCDV